MISKPDAQVHDGVALEEIELYGELMIAASAHDGPLTQAQIDDILGIPHEDRPRAKTSRPRTHRPKAASAH